MHGRYGSATARAPRQALLSRARAGCHHGIRWTPAVGAWRHPHVPGWPMGACEGRQRTAGAHSPGPTCPMHAAWGIAPPAAGGACCCALCCAGDVTARRIGVWCQGLTRCNIWGSTPNPPPPLNGLCPALPALHELPRLRSFRNNAAQCWSSYEPCPGALLTLLGGPPCAAVLQTMNNTRASAQQVRREPSGLPKTQLGAMARWRGVDSTARSSAMHGSTL